MTVESTARRQSFAGGQSALTFSFRSLVSHPEFIKVAVTSGGTQTVLTYATDYTVAMNSDGVGGIVTVSPTYSTAYTYTVYRDTDDLQESDYDDFNQFPADTLEDDLDRRTLISQERSDDLGRVPTIPISYTGGDISLPIPLDGYSLMWSGGNLVNTNLTGSTGSIGPTGPTGPSGGSVSLVSSSTSDITVVSTSTTPIITAVNAGTGGSQLVRHAAGGDIADEAWVDYSGTSTIGGFSGISSKAIYYKRVGKTIFVSGSIVGTSSTTALTFTLPFNAATPTPIMTIFSVDNGGTQVVGNAQVNAGGAIVNCYANAAAGAWTSSGTKQVIFNFSYQQA